MNRRNFRYAVIASMVSIAASGNAGTATVTPALAACSKALVETLARPDSVPTYTVRAPRPITSSNVDPNSFTVLAHSAKTRALLAKASCRATPDGEIVSFKSIPVKS